MGERGGTNQHHFWATEERASRDTAEATAPLQGTVLASRWQHGLTIRRGSQSWPDTCHNHKGAGIMRRTNIVERRPTNAWWVACLPVAVCLALGALTLPVRAQESQMDVVLKRDKLIVAQYSTSPPLAFVDDKGELVGFEIDMAREIAKDLLGDPKKVEFVVVQSDGRFPAALSGKIDFGLYYTTTTGDRAARIAFRSEE